MITGWQILWLLLGFYLYFGLISYRFFAAAGRSSWEAFVPVYNFWVLLKIIERPWWWIILLLLPVVGNVMLLIITYELLHVFRYSKIKHTLYTILSLGLYLGYLNYTAQLTYAGRDFAEIRKNVSELVASIFFAIVAATVIRAYTFEAFVIPTPSMEKSLMVGDFLFVSKLHYGSRLPITPLAVPLVHNKIPLINATSFSELVQLPTWRLPGFGDIKRNDPIVFNYPMEDEKPVDMRTHYVKRCIGTPGDTLEIINREVHINGQANELPPRALRQTTYYVRTNKVGFNPDVLKKQFDVNYLGRNESGFNDVTRLTEQEYIITLAEHHYEAFRQMLNVQEIIPTNAAARRSDATSLPPTLLRWYQTQPIYQVNGAIFPNSIHSQDFAVQWTRDNYGPIYIPRAGDRIELTPLNLKLYQRAIQVYEGHEIEQKNNQVYLNGEPATHYTFSMDYYWMMGDNRHNSEDSRFWGFVPEDHIVGKPVFIWMSYDVARGLLQGFRTERIFTTVSGNGPRRSYFWPFILGVVVFTVYNRFRKKKKNQAKSS